ncbi:MAG: hypothetical protein JSS77_15940 [Acidobacteria bacterium]|nr:hypothetical protein [Acidobacteriota bacterium]
MLMDLIAAYADKDKTQMRVRVVNDHQRLVVISFFAGLLSYALNHSFWWAIWAAILGGPYTAWTLFARHAEIIPALRAFFGA